MEAGVSHLPSVLPIAGPMGPGIMGSDLGLDHLHSALGQVSDFGFYQNQLLNLGVEVGDLKKCRVGYGKSRWGGGNSRESVPV